MVLYSFKKIVLESLPILVVSSVISIVSGNALNRVISTLIENPYFLVLLPAVAAISGNLGSIFSSRINSALHIGTIEPKLGRYRELEENIAFISILSFISFISLGVFSYLFCIIFNIKKIAFLDVIVISIFLSILFSIIIVLVSTITAFLSFKKGLDPDNTVIPVVTTVCDFTGVLSLILVIAMM